jgi:3-oxoacyl-[acyl-carrier protein] reductase
MPTAAARLALASLRPASDVSTVAPCSVRRCPMPLPMLPAMRRAHWGRIINVASGAVRLGRPNYLHYIATKAALAGMSLSMARELGKDGITVNAILPGATFTEIERKTVTPAQKERIIAMQCIPRAETPDDLVGTMLFLASPASAFVTGQSINLDGGVTG